MRVVVLALVLFTFAACGGGDSPQETATPEPTPAPVPEPPTTPPAPTPPAPPAQADGNGVPSGDLRGDPVAGGKVYGQFCATCHGPGGKGDGPAALADPKPADHTDAAYMGSLSDQHLYKVIDKGGASIGKSPLMAPWGGVLNEQQIKDVVAFVRTLSNT